MDELAAFGGSAAAAASAPPRAFADAVRGAAALAAAAELATQAGVDAVADWVVALAAADGGVRGAGGAWRPPPRAGLVHRAAVAALVTLLAPDDPPSSFDALFDALQAAAEAGGALDPGDEAVDDWLPATTLRAFAGGAVGGMAGVLGRVAGAPG